MRLVCVVPMAIVVGVMVRVVVRIGILVVTLFAMEHQEIHAERVKSRHEHTRQHCKVSKPSARQMALMHRLDDAVLGVKA